MTTTAGPLAGIRVVEFDGIGPVPLACMILADLGCEIVRLARRPGSGQVWDDTGGAVLNRNRKHVHVDLKQETDRQAVLDLIAGADALVEGFRPGVMERLGLGPDPCLLANPRLAYVRMTGWGQTGPLARRAGHDINYIALTGALHAMGRPDRPPEPPLNLVGDYGGGAMFAALGLLAAVIHARTTGQGQVVDVAMTDGVTTLSAVMHALLSTGLWSDQRGTNLLDGSKPFYRCYACADGEYVAVGAIEPQFFAELVTGLGLHPDDLHQMDPAGWPAMAAQFEAAFMSRTRDEWAAIFTGTDACVTPVLSFGEAGEHPHNRDRATIVAAGTVTEPGVAPRFGASPGVISGNRRGELTMSAALAAWASRS